MATGLNGQIGVPVRNHVAQAFKVAAELVQIQLPAMVDGIVLVLRLRFKTVT